MIFDEGIFLTLKERESEKERERELPVFYIRGVYFISRRSNPRARGACKPPALAHHA